MIKRNLWLNIVKGAVATLFGLIVIFPIFYAFSASFFSVSDFSTYPPKIFPPGFSPHNYVRAFKESLLLRFMLNSLIVATVGSFIRMAVAVLAAFAVAQLKFKGQNFLFFLILGTMMLPADALIIENYLTISKLGLIDSYLGIMSIYLLAPTQMFMLRQGFKSIPKTYREVAAIDGCGDFRFLLSVALPMMKSLVLTLWLHSFVTIWNTYLWPLLVTNKPQMRTVQVGITMLGYAESLDYGPIFAAISLLILPSLIIFLLLRKRIVAGIAAGTIVG
ncbi:MAG: carbohydrate ABC transporter permease [Sphaerochaetaceae bacterium]|jgi:sn-glycerol 3-phosphate transport system permease protein